jgi:hypothetical protein
MFSTAGSALHLAWVLEKYQSFIYNNTKAAQAAGLFSGFIRPGHILWQRYVVRMHAFQKSGFRVRWLLLNYPPAWSRNACVEKN